MYDRGEVITIVTEDENRFYISTKDKGFSLDKKYKTVPKVGDIVRIDICQGSLIRGIDLNGISIFYKTDLQLEQEHKEWCIELEKANLDRFQRNKYKLDYEYELLPDNFKKRIDRLRSNNPKFRIDFEEYELFCCKEALKIAEWCRTPEEVKKFSKKTWKEQEQQVPCLSPDHSGNTFDCACTLAYLHLSYPDSVYKVHGSLSSLVGSKEYGDISIEKIEGE